VSSYDELYDVVQLLIEKERVNWLLKET
jgi:hypothetical protein